MKKIQSENHGAGDRFDLLLSKIHPPAPGSDLVPRPHLLDRLDSTRGKKLVLVSTPAGFGKTTLISEWIRRKRIRAAWYSIGKEDNDPAGFLYYLITSLRSVESEVGTGALELLKTLPMTKPESVLTQLLNDLAGVSDDLILILDDYHSIEASEVHRITAFLLEHLPPRLQLVIATRCDPPLPLGRLRARDQMVELRAADLGFKGDETVSFFRIRLGRELASEDIRTLEERTEGWIAGLQLAALSLQKGRDVSRFIADFRGENRLVVDYLLEEVLDLQTEPVREFLLRSSILDRLTAPLCEAVTGRSDSRSLLIGLEKANLFLFPMDDTRDWFRFHALFGDLLRRRLRFEQPRGYKELHRRAAVWLESNSFASAAVEHYLKADQPQAAAGLIEEVAAGNWERGLQARLAEWFDALPPMQVESRPQLSLYHARALIMSGRHERAEQRLRAAEKALADTSDEVREILPDGTCRHYPLNRDELAGRIAALRALLASYRGDIPRIVENADRALKGLPRDDLVWRGVASATLGLAHGWSGDGDLKKSGNAFSMAAEFSEQAGNFAFHLFCANSHAAVSALQGKLRKAESLYSNLLRRARELGLAESGVTAPILCGLGALHCQKGDCGRGLPMLEEGVDLAGRFADHVVLAAAFFNLLTVRIWRLDAVGAAESARRYERIASEFQLPPWMEHYSAASRARLKLLEGDTGFVKSWIEERGLESLEDYDSRREPEFVVRALFLVIEEEWSAAEELLSRLIDLAEARLRIAAAVEMRILRALALAGEGRREHARNELRAALQRAEPEGMRLVFEGTLPALAGRMEGLLEEVLSESRIRKTAALTRFIQKILTARKARRPAARELPGLPDPLSDRELEVLRLMAAGLSNQEIADRLFISLNTVRTHTKNIHLKLDVHSRTQAAARAKDLDLL